MAAMLLPVANGQAQTEDLRLLGPLVSIGGKGTVDIPAQRLKFRVNPFMLASVVVSALAPHPDLAYPVKVAAMAVARIAERG